LENTQIQSSRCDVKRFYVKYIQRSLFADDEIKYLLAMFAYKCSLQKSNLLKQFFISFKGPGHALLGNFSTDQIVIELTK